MAAEIFNKYRLARENFEEFFVLCIIALFPCILFLLPKLRLLSKVRAEELYAAVNEHEDNI